MLCVVLSIILVLLSCQILHRDVDYEFVIYEIDIDKLIYQFLCFNNILLET
jgi:hypothetical protein